MEYSDEMHFKIVHFNIKTQNLGLVNRKCVTYAQPIFLSLRRPAHFQQINGVCHEIRPTATFNHTVTRRTNGNFGTLKDGNGKTKQNKTKQNGLTLWLGGPRHPNLFFVQFNSFGCAFWPFFPNCLTIEYVTFDAKINKWG